MNFQLFFDFTFLPQIEEIFSPKKGLIYITSITGTSVSLRPKLPFIWYKAPFIFDAFSQLNVKESSKNRVHFIAVHRVVVRVTQSRTSESKINLLGKAPGLPVLSRQVIYIKKFFSFQEVIQTVFPRQFNEHRTRNVCISYDNTPQKSTICAVFI